MLENDKASGQLAEGGQPTLEDVDDGLRGRSACGNEPFWTTHIQKRGGANTKHVSASFWSVQGRGRVFLSASRGLSYIVGVIALSPNRGLESKLCSNAANTGIHIA